MVQIPLNSKSQLEVLVRDGPLENLWGGGGRGAGEVQKKYSRKGKLNEKKKKNHARQLTLKNIHAMA